MPTLYRIQYTRTNISNTKMTSSGAAGDIAIPLSTFTASGDTSKHIGTVVGVTFKHYHTASSSSSANSNGINIRSYLRCGIELIYSPWQKWNTFNSSSSIAKIDTFGAIKAAQIAQLNHIGIECQPYTSSSSLYYRALSKEPMILTIDFYEESDEGIIRVRDGANWVKTQPYVYDNGIWRKSLPSVYDNGQWKRIGE